MLGIDPAGLRADLNARVDRGMGALLRADSR